MNSRFGPATGRRVFFIFAYALAFLTSGSVLHYIASQSNADPSEYALHAQKNLQDAELRMQAQLEEYGKKFFDNDWINFGKSNNEFGFLLYEDDSLIFWTDNRIAFPTHPSRFKNNALIKLRNGWYESRVLDSRGKKIIALLPIRSEYSYQNKFLRNEFNPIFGLPEGTRLCEKAGSDCVAIKSSSDIALFSFSIPEHTSRSGFIDKVAILILLIGVLMLIYSIHRFGQILTSGKYPVRGYLIFVLILLVLRVCMMLFSFPSFLYADGLFSPNYYASSAILPSLGDLLLHCLVLFYLVSFFRKQIPLDSISGKMSRPFAFYPLVALSAFAVSCLVLFCYSLLRGLVLNSSISFDVNDLFSLNRLSLYSFVVIGVLLSALFVFTDLTAVIISHIRKSLSFFLVASLTGFLLFILAIQFIHPGWIRTDAGLLVLGFSAMLFMVVYYLQISYEKLNFSHLFPVIVLLSVFTAFNLFSFNEEKEKSARTIIAGKLSNEQDRMAEHLFTELEMKITVDTVIRGMFDTTDAYKNIEPGVRHLHQQYFNGYWSKYNTKLHVYDFNGAGLFNSNNENVSLAYFRKNILEFGIPTFSKNFYFLSNSRGSTSYIARIQIFGETDNQDSLQGTLIVELDLKPVIEQSGTPDILLSEGYTENNSEVPVVYSYAQYKNGKLTHRFGNYAYYSHASAFGKISNRYQLKDGFSHYLYLPDEERVIVVSRKNPGVGEFFTLFSYLFAFFSVFMLLLVVFRQLPITLRMQLFSFESFGGRLQRVMILIVFLSMVVTGGGTAYYIITEYNHRQKERVLQRTNSMLIAVQNRLSENGPLNSFDLRNLTYDLMTLSVSSATEYNIYDLNGNVLFSTQTKLFEQEIISEKMNAAAMHELHLMRKSSFIHEEHIGRLNFIAAYESLHNANNELIGYLGLPYFSNQSELNKEISSFIIALINIYVLLFALALILSVLATERITLPLRLIRQRIGHIQIGVRNEPMQWDSKDEIGDLIREYNRMVKELENSAEKLARSERESAWREMARQVAHEIKNPLTPMKLSIQHLQRAWNEKSPQLDEIMKKISATIIQQIDTLSAIASEFSNFAQMPKPNNEILELKDILQNCISLFSDHSATKINLIEGKEQSYFVRADKDQLLRVFNNLMNNALEAIPETREGVIEISIARHGLNHVVSVTDNGSGIPTQLREKIFEPNFTTKTSGMGLGLAMVKNIVESAGGTIRYESRENIGTTFYVELPAVENR